jgi:hypothetical protein
MGPYTPGAAGPQRALARQGARGGPRTNGAAGGVPGATPTTDNASEHNGANGGGGGKKQPPRSGDRCGGLTYHDALKQRACPVWCSSPIRVVPGGQRDNGRIPITSPTRLDYAYCHWRRNLRSWAIEILGKMIPPVGGSGMDFAL